MITAAIFKARVAAIVTAPYAIKNFHGFIEALHFILGKFVGISDETGATGSEYIELVCIIFALNPPATA